MTINSKQILVTFIYYVINNFILNESVMARLYKMSKSYRLNHSFHKKHFPGNTDRGTPVSNYFDVPVQATYLRILPTEWNGKISLRLEILGCNGKLLKIMLKSELIFARCTSCRRRR